MVLWSVDRGLRCHGSRHGLSRKRAQARTWHPNSSSPSPPKEFPSGPVEGRAVLCAVDMEIDPNAIPIYGAASRTRSCASGLRSAPSPSVRRQRSPSCSAAAPVRICTTLRHFAPLCSDFEAGPHLRPSSNQSLVPPIPCVHSRPKTVPIDFRISVQFWHSFGPVFAALNSQLLRGPKLCRCIFPFRSSFGTVLVQFLALSTFNSQLSTPRSKNRKKSILGNRK